MLWRHTLSVVHEADIRSIVRDELERREFVENGRRFRREMNWITGVVVLEVLAIYALIIWRGI